MPLELKIPDMASKYLNRQAESHYKKAVEGYAEDLLKEASRLEATAKSGTGDPEITSTMVKDADLLLRRGWVRPAKKPYLILAQIIATIGGFLTGLLADMDKLKDVVTLVVFVVLLTVTITATVVAVLKD